MSGIGSLHGRLQLVVGGAVLDLGNVSIPLVARHVTSTGGDIVSIEASLKTVRELVQQFLTEQGGES